MQTKREQILNQAAQLIVALNGYLLSNKEYEDKEATIYLIVDSEKTSELLFEDFRVA